MTDLMKMKKWGRIGLSILIVGSVFGLIAVAARWYFGDIGITAVDIGITGVLTAALVYLYFQQTRILESQRDLFTQQMNREARQQHTETLRERVKKWHGNPERKPVSDPTQGPSKNLPSVRGATFESAKNIGVTLQFGAEHDEFHTVPRELRDDPYFSDLLENHAQDLQERKSNIERLHSKFTSLRTRFSENYDDAIVKEHDEYYLEPDPLLAEWIFELVVLAERGRLYGNDTILDRAKSDIERSDASPLVPDESKLRFRADLGPRAVPIYSAVFDEADADKLSEFRKEAEQNVMNLVEKIVDRIDDDKPYTYAREAAEILDSANNQVNELEELLIEYYGRPIYSGDCKYLQEARI